MDAPEMTVDINAGTYSKNVPTITTKKGGIPSVKSQIVHGIPSLKVAIARELTSLKARSASKYKVRAATYLLNVLDQAPYLRVSPKEIQWITTYDNAIYDVESNVVWVVSVGEDRNGE